MLIVALGGTTRPDSSTERALVVALRTAAAAGCETLLFDGAFLAALPHYDPAALIRTPKEIELVEAVRRADGLILGTPAYHGGVSGLVKNALDLLEETVRDHHAYLDGVPVGLLVTAGGWQATGATLASLRSIVHALRGWPTPLGVTINTGAGPAFRPDGACVDTAVAEQLAAVTSQVVDFARRVPPDTAIANGAAIKPLQGDMRDLARGSGGGRGG